MTKASSHRPSPTTKTRSTRSSKPAAASSSSPASTRGAAAVRDKNQTTDGQNLHPDPMTDDISITTQKKNSQKNTRASSRRKAAASSTVETDAPPEPAPEANPPKKSSARSTSKQKKQKKAKAEPKKKTSKGTRDESSLKQLTKRFIQLISDSDDGSLDLNEASKHLSVPKRRIYDITNVLEGIGLIEKKTKNIIQWKGSGIAVNEAQTDDQEEQPSQEEESQQEEESEELLELKQELATLQNSLQQVNTNIETEQQTLKRLTSGPDHVKHAYVCTSDIKKIPSLKNRTIIAVRAPSGTTLTVPDPDEGMQYPQRRFQIFLHSQSDPINVLLLSDENGTVHSASQAASQQHQQRQAQLAAAMAAQQQQSQPQHSQSHSVHPSHSIPSADTAGQFEEEEDHVPPHTPPRHAEFNIKTPPSHSIYQQHSPDPTYGMGSMRHLSPPKPEPDYIYSESKFSVQELYE